MQVGDVFDLNIEPGSLYRFLCVFIKSVAVFAAGAENLDAADAVNLFAAASGRCSAFLNPDSIATAGAAALGFFLFFLFLSEQ